MSGGCDGECSGPSRRRDETRPGDEREKRVCFVPGCARHECRNSYDETDESDECCQEQENERPVCTKDLRAAAKCKPPPLRGVCPRKDVIAQLTPTTDLAGVRRVIQQVANEEITTAAEFIFCITSYVSDHGAAFREILEKELSFFRDIVNDTVDRRIQDEADVMMNTQNDIKNKFRSLTDAMIQRTIRIRQRLYEISPTFNWARDGRDRAKLAKLIAKPVSKDGPKEKESTDTSNVVDKLVHQVFMRSEWLKKELTRLQEENDNLEFFLEKFRILAKEREEEASHVPKMLSRQKKQLERELNELRKTHKKNLEIINALYLELQRCVMPGDSEISIVE